MPNIYTRFALPLLVATFVCASCFAQENKPASENSGTDAPPAAADPLDEELLQDLDSDLLEGLDDLPELDLEPTGKKETQDKPGQLNPESSGAEDAVTTEAVNPLIRISEQMRQVETRLTSSDTSEQTQKIQQDILQELTMVIQQLKQQQKQQQQQSSNDQQQKKNQQQKQKGDKPSNGGKPQGNASQQPSNKPSRDSSEDVRKPEDVEAENRELKLMLKEVWGHLPDRVRQQMMNARVEQLLPKYQKLIEEYYKRLAEDRDN